MMKRIIHSLCLFIICQVSVLQLIANDSEGSGHTVGISVGPSFALTDLGGANKIGAPFIRDIDFKATRYTVSAFYRYNVNKWFSVRANLMYGMLKADDNNTDGTPPGPDGPTASWYRARRNLNFETHLVEFQAIGEVNLKKYIYDEGKGSKERWAPYIGGGLGFFWFNSYTRLNGDKVKLRPLGTEGQYIRNATNGYAKPYKNFNFDLIAVVGIKYNINQKFSIAIEGMYHQTFTDYLDDVSGNYINPQDVPLLSTTAQILQNRANAGRYPNDDFNFVEGQKGSNPSQPTYGLLLPSGIGQQRGDKKDNDQFMHLQVTFTFNIIRGDKLGFGSCGRRNPYHHKFSCPKW